MKRALAAAFALTVVLGGCGDQGSRPLTRLQAMPEAQLSFPGATVLGEIAL